MPEKHKLAKIRYVNHVIFFKLHDFYETYDEDAEKVSKILGITLITRNGHKLCGFPKHCVNDYFKKIEDAGLLPAFIREEQIKDLIEKMEKNMENKKTINEKAFKHIGFRYGKPNSYYWFNQETGVLEQVSIDSIVMNLAS